MAKSINPHRWHSTSFSSSLLHPSIGYRFWNKNTHLLYFQPNLASLIGSILTSLSYKYSLWSEDKVYQSILFFPHIPHTNKNPPLQTNHPIYHLVIFQDFLFLLLWICLLEYHPPIAPWCWCNIFQGAFLPEQFSAFLHLNVANFQPLLCIVRFSFM